jgi:hypothetical protein
MPVKKDSRESLVKLEVEDLEAQTRRCFDLGTRPRKP